MFSEVLNPRRAPRVLHRCEVEVRDRFASWTAESEDLGPRGCQLVTPRIAAPGRALKLQFRCLAIGKVIRATGQVVWSRATEPCRMGIQFDPTETDPGWFARLVEADPFAAEAATRLPDRLPRSTELFLGRPPRLLADFSAEEVAVLRRIGPGITLEALAAGLGSSFERVRGAVFSLLARRLLVRARADAIAAEAWAGLLRSAEGSLAAEGIRLPGPTTGAEGASGRSAAAQALFDEGIAHLTGGRLEVAVARLREARSLAPHDAMIAGALQRLAPWTSAGAAPAPVAGVPAARRR